MLMKIFSSLLPSMTPENTKVHLAQFDGKKHPMDVYLAGDFDNWQSWQTKKNFNKEYLISFVEIPGTKKWLFAGVYDSLEIDRTEKTERGTEYVYRFRRAPEFSALEGRWIIDYRKSRANYIHLSTCIDAMSLSHVLEEPMNIGKFPGFKQVDISHGELQTIVRQGLESWSTALASVAGVYLISDRTDGEHQLYVGSATGVEGLWNRWCSYANNGHGNNIGLRELHAKRGQTFSENFRFSILEIADKHTGVEEMRLKEQEWKRRLLTRDSGLNRN